MDREELVDHVRGYALSYDSTLLRVVLPISCLATLLYILCGLPDDLDQIALLLGGASGVVATFYTALVVKWGLEAPPDSPARSQSGEEMKSTKNNYLRR